MEYAFESQGSIYYRGDRITAEAAVFDCLSAYNELLANLNCEATQQDIYEKAGEKLQALKARFDELPLEAPNWMLEQIPSITRVDGAGAERGNKYCCTKGEGGKQCSQLWEAENR